MPVVKIGAMRVCMRKRLVTVPVGVTEPRFGTGMGVKMMSVVVAVAVRVLDAEMGVEMVVPIAQDERHRERKHEAATACRTPNGSPNEATESAAPKNGALAKMACARVAPRSWEASM